MVLDESLLDAEEAKMLRAIIPPARTSSLPPLSDPPPPSTQNVVPGHEFRSQIRERMEKLQTSVAFQVDHLVANVHVLDQRVAVAGREADLMLRLGASRLKAREDREKAAVGTKDMPVMEVLRSLSRILPDSGGGGKGKDAR